MTDEDKPRPCPFCGKSECYVTDVGDSRWFQVVCGCGARGPMEDPEAEAITRWNAAAQDSKRLDWYLHRSRVRGWDHDRTSIETGSDYLSGIRKWIDECLNAEGR